MQTNSIKVMRPPTPLCIAGNCLLADKKEGDDGDGGGRGGRDKGRVEELVTRAKSLLSSTEKPGRIELWRAYVAVEYAILDLKLRYRIEGEVPPPKAKPARKKAKATSTTTTASAATTTDSADLATARSMLDAIDFASAGKEKKLLYDLRSCRDVLKSLVASYARRSTTS